jgi:hypothetical protein
MALSISPWWSLIWHVYHSCLKLPVITIKFFMEGKKHVVHRNGLKIEIINLVSIPIIIKKNMKVTGVPIVSVVAGNMFGPKKTYELEIESRDSFCITQPAWNCESYSALSKRGPAEQLPLHLFLAKVFIGFHGKLRKGELRFVLSYLNTKGEK